jgi:hypothetical protein
MLQSASGELFNNPLFINILSKLIQNPRSRQYKFRQVLLYWIYTNEVSFTRSKIVLKWETLDICEWIGIHPIQNVLPKQKESERKIRMNGVGCTLYEMFDQKGKHRERRTSVQLQYQ